MANDPAWSRLRRRIRSAWRWLRSLVERLSEALFGADANVHTTVTFRAIVDAVVPETPALVDDPGADDVPGGLAVDLDDFALWYVDNGFQLGFPHVGPRGNIPLATPIAHVLDAAALALVKRGENVSEPTSDRPVSLLEPGEASPDEVREEAGMFSKLSRRDRLRAVALIDEIDIEVSPVDDELFEFDAGLVGQLVVGFTEMIYYSEWEGYDEFAQPPSERVHPNDPAAVQSWRQTGYPGFADGYASLRGYLGSDDSPLGDGDPWETVDGDAASPVRITRRSGSFRDNEYDTSGYEEPYPE